MPSLGQYAYVDDSAEAQPRLALHRRRGTLLRWIRGNVVGLLTAGFIEDDTFEPQRFEVVVRVAGDERVRGRIAAGFNPQEAQALLDLLKERPRHTSLQHFMSSYGDG